MRSLPPPSELAGDAFDLCISRVRDRNLKRRLVAAKPAIVSASDRFIEAAARFAAHEIAPHDLVDPDVTVDEMEGVCTDRMANGSGPGRPVYEEIKNSAPNGRCPLCGHRQVKTLDHYLPKSRYPSLAVSPVNLIPSCSDCNKAKMDLVPKVPTENPLHPYFDNLGVEPWLIGTVIEERPSAVRFAVVPPASWDPVLAARVRRHFEVLELAVLYGSEAAEELSGLRHELILMSDKAGSSVVRSELEARAVSREMVRPNEWRAAAYRAWANSAWFCEGGFR